MDELEELRELRRVLGECLHKADRLNLSMAGIYISHALEHVEYVTSQKPAPPVLRSVKGGKKDD